MSELMRWMVAPHAGAWIEMKKGSDDYDEAIGRSPCGSVD